MGTLPFEMRRPGADSHGPGGNTEIGEGERMLLPRHGAHGWLVLAAALLAVTVGSFVMIGLFGPRGAGRDAVTPAEVDAVPVPPPPAQLERRTAGEPPAGLPTH